MPPGVSEWLITLIPGYRIDQSTSLPAYPVDCSKCCLSIIHTSRRIFPPVMPPKHRKRLIFKSIVMAYQTHT